MGRRTLAALAAGLLGVVLLTACNPILNQPTAVRDGGVSRSGRVAFTGERGGWLEVEVRSSADVDVSVLVGGRDTTRPDDGVDDDWCYFATPSTPAWSDGSSLGYQRLAWIGPGAELTLQFTAPTEGLTFDARVVDEAGDVVGDLTHDVPTPGFEAVWGAICAH